MSRTLALLALVALSSCGTRGEPPAKQTPSLVARLSTMRGLGFVGRGERPSVEGARWHVPAAGPRPAVEGTTTAKGARITAGGGAFVEVEPQRPAKAAGAAQQGAFAFDDTVWTWSAHAVEHFHVVPELRVPELALHVGPEIRTIEVRDDRLWLFDADGYAQLQTDAAWIEDAHGLRRTVRPRIEGTLPDVRLILDCELGGLVPPLVVDPAWTKIPSMSQARFGSPTVALADGKVLVITGESSTASFGTYEIYDPATNTWTFGTGVPNGYTSYSHAARLTSGKVLVTGVYGSGNADVFDPATKTWTPASPMSKEHSYGAVVALADGRALVIGGAEGSGSGATSTVEIYNPGSNSFSAAASMSSVRVDPGAVLRSDGKVFVMGGRPCAGCTTSTTEVWDPATNKWSAGPALADAHGNAQPVKLADGRILEFGSTGGAGSSDVELFDGTSFSLVGTAPTEPRMGATFGTNRALLLEACLSFATCSAANVFDGSKLVAVDPPSVPRVESPMMVALPGNKVLVAGGKGLDGPLSAAEVFAPIVAGDACAGSGSCAAPLVCVDGVCCESTCAATETCAGPATKGKCRAKNGQSCTSAATCASGLCVDGVCCDRACTGKCEACDDPSSRGTCLPIAGAPHGTRPACTASVTACGLTCDGIDGTKCTYASKSTPCSSDSCSAGVERHARLCDGAGVCDDTPKPCGAYTCGKTACKTTCATSADCASGFGCKASICVPAEGLGTACTSGAECTSGFCVDGVCCASSGCSAGSRCDVAGKVGSCQKTLGAPCSATAECGVGTCVDGVCCDGACTGACEACDVPGKEGTCSAVLGAPHGTRAACDAGSATCDPRTCDGKERSSCQGFVRGTETTCADAKCEGPSFVGVAHCDGAGACKAPSPSSCAPYVCAATGCKVACAVDGDCQSGFRCVSERCVAAGAKCSADGLSSESNDGRVVACSPYACNGSNGTCRGACLGSEDCAPGFVCGSGICTTGSAPAPAEEGGGCSFGHRTRGGGLALFVLLGVLVAVRRRSAHVLAVAALAACSSKTKEPPSSSEPIALPAASTRDWSTPSGTVPTIVNPVVVAQPDGSALVFGSYDGSVQLFASGAVTKIATLSKKRQNPLVARLPSGKVLLAGGFEAGVAYSSTELFDPATKTSTPGPNMSAARSGLASVVLASGDILVAGGNDLTATTTAERYLTATNTWSATGPMPYAHKTGVAALLASGKVFYVSLGADDRHALLYDPATNAWTVGPSLIGFPRYDARLARMPSGKVLVSGGIGWDWGTFAEIYDPATGSFSKSAPHPQWFETMLTTLPSGRVLAAGGSGYAFPRADTSVYDPATDTWIPASPLAQEIPNAGAAVLPDGRVLLAGNADHVAVFTEGSLGASCTEKGDCKNLQCVDGVCCATASCAAGSVCSAPGGACKLAIGTACTTSASCGSGNCVDGVCCDTACTSQCAACNVAGKVGTCSPVLGNPRGSRAACSGAGLGTACGPSCDGLTTATCTFGKSGTPCGADACVAGIETKKSTCDGGGGCVDTSLACSPYACGTTACKTSCTSASECAPGSYCKGTACVPVEGLGAACTTATDCTSGNCVDGVCCATASCPSGLICNDPARKGSCAIAKGSKCTVSAECATGSCVDGVCCDTACDGQCEACDVAEKVGTCSTVDGAPHGTRPACTTAAKSERDAPCAARTCLGSKDAKTCAGFAVSAGTACAPARCETASFVSASTCDGVGACAAETKASCAPYVCNATGCLTSCTFDLDCVSGFRCTSGKCVPEGTACTADLLASVDKDGKVTQCAPYRCRTDGTCNKDCGSSDDCAPGSICDVPSKTCSVPAAEDSGGGCAMGRPSPRTGGLGLALALALIGARRRRR
jgi:hypothetical protein